MVRCLMMAPEHLYYFGGYDSWVSVNSPQALIVTAGADQPGGRKLCTRGWRNTGRQRGYRRESCNRTI